MAAAGKDGDRLGDDGIAAGAYTDFSQAMGYGEYLRLDEILGAQKPLSPEHDEMLFIIIHQAKELWMKLALHELEAALRQIRSGELRPAFKMLARVSRIQEQLIQAWTVLSTMTPADYVQFRPYLGKSSGFQSFQYRMLEFTLGNKDGRLAEPHRHQTDRYDMLQERLARPSLYDEAILLLARRGFAIDKALLERDWRTPHSLDASVLAAWEEVYRHPETYWDLYELAEKLLDLEDAFQQWRFRHRMTVERIIGGKPGTGGTAGVGYLRKALDTVFFPELWEVRTRI
ncbi:MAG TPA: tryptophan 2,3-dioxygenase [Azospirillaceae bacterium]|nr:tryptophan 2,3-dioxygenase [Azospirillaceae bacterium]